MCSGFEQYRGSGRRNAAACNRWRAEKNQQGDYYAGDKMVLNAKRMAAIKKCTDGIKFTVTSHACRRRVSLPKRSGGELQARPGEIDLAVSVARHFSGVHCHGFGICCYAEWL